MSQPPPSPGLPHTGHARPKAAAPKHKVIVGVVIAAIVIAVAAIGIPHLRFALAHEETDDAQIEGHISPVLPRVSGYVTQVLVVENQHVVAGQPLVEIEPNELDLRVGAAEAALKSAQAAVATAQAGLASARADEAVARATAASAAISHAKAASDLARDQKLFQTDAITDRQQTDSRASADEAAAQLEVARRQVGAAGTRVAAAQAQIAAIQAQADQRRTDLDFARLQRSYATVTAPISGLVSRKDIEVGQFVQTGQTLLSIASDADVWVVANFKETQLARLQPGQSAEFTADDYPGVTFHGRIESIAGATGARFALLPPDNSSGNFVKVTQRVPVKIVLTAAPDAQHVLRPGVSVDVAVLTKE